MTTYIGVKIVDAVPMTRQEYNDYRGWELPPDEDGNDLGFLKNDGAGHFQWDPKESFERDFFPMSGSDGTKITQDMVDTFMGTVRSQQLDEKTTHVCAETVTGFKQHEISCCVDPRNYDHEIGVGVASKCIENTLWKCLGFVLQWGLFGIKKEGK